MVAQDELNGNFGRESLEQSRKLRGNLIHRRRFMDNVAEKDNGFRIVAGKKVFKAGEDAVAWPEWQHLSVESLGPHVTEVKIGHGERVLFFEKDRAPMVQP